jgi:hypothetical protein
MGRREEPTPIGSLEDYVKIEGTAKILGVCTRTVKMYGKYGLLDLKRIKGQGRWKWVRRDEVVALREVLDEQGSARSLVEMLRGLRVRLLAMDRRLNFLMFVNDLDVTVLRDVPDEKLIKLYDEVCEYVEAPSNDRRRQMAHIQGWAQTIMQITELELERLVGPTQDTTPWVPFYKLIRMLMEEVRGRKHFSHNESFQFTYRLLDRARKSLGQAIVVFTEAQAAEIGPRRTQGLYKIGASEDSLTRYIQSDAEMRITQ